MKVVAAYLLALLGGNPSPTEKDIGTILSSVGAEAEDDRIAFFFKSFQGRDVSEVLALGQERFASLGGGGGGGVVVSAGGGGGGGAASAAAAEAPKVEEKKEEPKEESDDDMGFSLFD